MMRNFPHCRPANIAHSTVAARTLSMAVASINAATNSAVRAHRIMVASVDHMASHSRVNHVVKVGHSRPAVRRANDPVVSHRLAPSAEKPAVVVVAAVVVAVVALAAARNRDSRDNSVAPRT